MTHLGRLNVRYQFVCLRAKGRGQEGEGGLTLNHMREEDRQILSAELGWGEGRGGRRRLTVDH